MSIKQNNQALRSCKLRRVMLFIHGQACLQKKKKGLKMSYLITYQTIKINHYAIKELILISFFLFSLICFSQNKKKETVFLLFDKQSDEKYLLEDGSGNTIEVNKFRKEVQGEHIYFKICDEIFSTHKTKSFKETCPIEYLDSIELVDIIYLKEKYDAEFEFKHHVFDKIFFIEKISAKKIIKYEVSWVDEIIMIED